MNFNQVRTVLETLTQSLPALFSNIEIQYYFFDNSLPIGDWSGPESMGMLVTGDGIGCKSGVYFFASPEGEIIYIGKATKSNLHHRVWDHCKTPMIMHNGKRTFPRNGFSCARYSSQANYILSGDARLGVVTVSDPELVSLMEVFLHTMYIKEHNVLPALNKQIG